MDISLTVAKREISFIVRHPSGPISLTTQGGSPINFSVAQKALSLSASGNAAVHTIVRSYEPIEKVFTSSDFVNGELVIGTTLANRRIRTVSLIISTPFNTGSLTIGDQAAQGRLMVAADNNLLVANNTYITFPFYSYSQDTLLKAFLSGSPSQGAGIILISY